MTRVFVKVVQNGSFSRAAEILRLPTSTVSKSVSKLERETGTKLLLRTTRSLALTESGKSFFESCLGPITQLEDAQKSLSGRDTLLTGTLKITSPEDIGIHLIAPAIAHLSRMHSNIFFDVEFRNDVIDLIKDGFDIAVRIGAVKDTSLKVKKAGYVVLVAVAAPEYLQHAKKLKRPDDLSQHDCLTMNYEKMAKQWNLQAGPQRVQVNIKPRILANHMTALLEMANAAGGVALVPSYSCQEDIKSGKLVRVLPEWSSIGLPISILTPLPPSSSARLKVTTDHLIAVLNQGILA